MAGEAADVDPALADPADMIGRTSSIMPTLIDVGLLIVCVAKLSLQLILCFRCHCRARRVSRCGVQGGQQYGTA